VQTVLIVPRVAAGIGHLPRPPSLRDGRDREYSFLNAALLVQTFIFEGAMYNILDTDRRWQRDRHAVSIPNATR
jgi:hypothetical protein